MKRKEKSAYEKRIESKRKSLEEAASAAGQKSLPTFFAKDAGATEKQVQQQHMLSVTESDVNVQGNQNDITDGRQSPQDTSSSIDAQPSCWYKSNKLDIDWLLLSEDCLKVTREVKDKCQRPVMKCLLCRKYELEVRRFANNQWRTLQEILGGRVPKARAF